MRIFDEAGLDDVAVEDLKTKLGELIEDGATHEDVIRRGVELYDRDAFVIGILIGMEIREANLCLAYAREIDKLFDEMVGDYVTHDENGVI